MEDDHECYPDTAAQDRRARRVGGALRGELLLPASVGYDTGRRIWNGAIDRRPAGIARCTGVADVVAAVRYARERGVLVAVRSGGHGVGGHALCDGGLVIDLSPMRGIRVDPAARTARAEAGVLWGELDRDRNPSTGRPCAPSLCCSRRDEAFPLSALLPFRRTRCDTRTFATRLGANGGFELYGY